MCIYLLLRVNYDWSTEWCMHIIPIHLVWGRIFLAKTSNVCDWWVNIADFKKKSQYIELERAGQSSAISVNTIEAFTLSNKIDITRQLKYTEKWRALKEFKLWLREVVSREINFVILNLLFTFYLFLTKSLNSTVMKFNE